MTSRQHFTLGTHASCSVYDQCVSSDTNRTIGAVWRIESPRVIAGQLESSATWGSLKTLRTMRCFAALEQWPASGIPRNPGAWLMATAKHRAIDLLRRRTLLERKHQELGYELESRRTPRRPTSMRHWTMTSATTCCAWSSPPAIPCSPPGAACAHAATARRIDHRGDRAGVPRVRADGGAADRQGQETLAKERVPFEVPSGDELAVRLSSVLEVIYLIFNEGYAATSGEDWIRPALCEDALRLRRVPAGLMPGEPGAWPLVALMKFRHRVLPSEWLPTARRSCSSIRTGHCGTRPDSTRSCGIEQAERCGPTWSVNFLQASIAACHARAREASATDWRTIANLYAGLLAVSPSPVVQLNRAVALSMALGPQAGLALVDTLVGEPALENYHLLPSVRGDLLVKVGRVREAMSEFERAVVDAQRPRARFAARTRSRLRGRGVTRHCRLARRLQASEGAVRGAMCSVRKSVRKLESPGTSHASLLSNRRTIALTVAPSHTRSVRTVEAVLNQFPVV